MDAVDRLRHAARDPLGQTLPRCADACPSADFRSPQERINAAQIEADEMAESWLARHGFKIAAALMVLVFAVVTAVRAADKLDADLAIYHQFRSMK